LQISLFIEHRSQNKNLAVPSGRKEVSVLNEWLENMLAKVAAERNLKLKDFFEYTQIIYSACLQEIIRQVSLHCSERGQLLQKVWDAYINFLERGIVESMKEKATFEKEYLSHTSSLHKIYQKKLEKCTIQINELTTEKAALSEKSTNAKDENKYMKKKSEEIR